MLLAHHSVKLTFGVFSRNSVSHSLEVGFNAQSLFGNGFGAFKIIKAHMHAWRKSNGWCGEQMDSQMYCVVTNDWGRWRVNGYPDKRPDGWWGVFSDLKDNVSAVDQCVSIIRARKEATPRVGNASLHFWWVSVLNYLVVNATIWRNEWRLLMKTFATKGLHGIEEAEQATIHPYCLSLVLTPKCCMLVNFDTIPSIGKNERASLETLGTS